MAGQHADPEAEDIVILSRLSGAILGARRFDFRYVDSKIGVVAVRQALPGLTDKVRRQVFDPIEALNGEWFHAERSIRDQSPFYTLAIGDGIRGTSTRPLRMLNLRKVWPL